MELSKKNIMIFIGLIIVIVVIVTVIVTTKENFGIIRRNKTRRAKIIKNFPNKMKLCIGDKKRTKRRDKKCANSIIHQMDLSCNRFSIGGNSREKCQKVVYKYIDKGNTEDKKKIEDVGTNKIKGKYTDREIGYINYAINKIKF
jgi:hypothetical protein